MVGYIRKAGVLIAWRIIIDSIELSHALAQEEDDNKSSDMDLVYT